MMPVFEFLPYCALACIIEVAVVGLIDFHGFKTAWRVSKPEFTVSVVTFVAVLGLGIELGVLIGAGISLAIVRGVRARSARISIISHFHVLITSLEYHARRSLIPQESHSKVHARIRT